MRLLGTQTPPGGPPDKLADQVDRLMTDYPLQYVFPEAVIGPDNAATIFRASGAESHRRLALAEMRAHEARLWSVFCADALDRVGRRTDRPDRDSLSCFFGNDVIEEQVAERIARAVELYWDDQPDESAHVLVPRLERVLREVARKVGIPIVREPRDEGEFGGVATLGVLVRELEGAFADKGWHAYLENLLTDPLGLNLRNQIAHGLHNAVHRREASLLVQAAVRLAGLSLEPVENAPPPPAGAGPA
jgi:hypothetical protein